MVFAEKFHLYRGILRLTIEIYSPQRTNYMVKVNLHFLSGQKVKHNKAVMFCMTGNYTFVY